MKTRKGIILAGGSERARAAHARYHKAAAAVYDKP